MHLTTREEERIQIWAMAQMGRNRLERGVKLNAPESIAVICDEILERAREGDIRLVTELIEYGGTILKKKDVMEGVPELVPQVQIEAVMPDGTKLVTVDNPIRD
jgi:urease gamma subunit